MVPDGRLTLTRCNLHTEVTGRQLAALHALPGPVEPVTPYVVCELAASHADDHVAFAVASHGGDRWWWIRWGRQQHAIVRIDPCAVTEPEMLGLEICLFPDGHPGSHSFDLQPWPARVVGHSTAAPFGAR